jgi:hypothetical protein
MREMRNVHIFTENSERGLLEDLGVDVRIMLRGYQLWFKDVSVDPCGSDRDQGLALVSDCEQGHGSAG